MERSNIYTVVMAGGRGEHFWPQSRQNCPKQLLRLLGSLTLIEQTTARMLSVSAPENCLVIEDSEKGIAAGKNAGMKTIALLDRRFGLKQARADMLIESLLEVLDCVKYF